MSRLIFALFFPAVLSAQIPDFSKAVPASAIPTDSLLAHEAACCYQMTVDEANVCCHVANLPAISGDSISLQIFVEFHGGLYSLMEGVKGRKSEFFPIWIPFRLPHWVLISDDDCTLVLKGVFLENVGALDWRPERVLVDCIK